MKKTLTIILSGILALTLILSLAGCKSSDKPAEQKETTAQAAEEATQAATQDKNAAVIAAADVIFSYNGTSVELNSEVEPVLTALGAPVSESSQLSCHGEGEDKTYTYNGFIVNTYPLDGKDRVLEVVIQNQGIPTSKGVQVGDPVSKVTEAYGDNYRSVGMYYAYSAGDGKSLQFFIENDAVKEIDYYYDV